jgi:hypothetical protein
MDMRTTSKLVFALVMLMMAAVLSAQAASDKYKITTLSSRPDMISGGDVLVQVDLPTNVAATAAMVRLNGQDVSAALHADQSGHALVGIVTGLRVGDNKLEVFNGSGGKAVAEANLKNYPITGPIISGPQEHPFVCQTQDFRMPDKTTLGAPLDDNCSVKTVVSYVYKSTEPAPPAERRGGGGAGGGAGRGGAPAAEGAEGGGGAAAGAAPAALNLKPLTNMTTLPADVAYTTTTTGDKVPFIVRVETGTINRGIYQFVVLSDPTKESNVGPLNPPKEWNKRLLYSFGPGCVGGWNKQGISIGNGGVINENVVGKGYAEAGSTLNVFGNDCSEVIAAETFMMVKERFIKAYGQPEITFSRGGSGGSEQQLPIADNYPGLLDGIIPGRTFPDVLTNAQNVFDSQLLNDYFAKSGASLTDEQKLAVTGEAALRDASTDLTRINPKTCPMQIPESDRFSPANPKGARCDVFDHYVNIYGRDPATGYARRPLDNVGVQYGLAAMNAGKITVAQFIDLNQKVGGYDNNGLPQATRTVADPVALQRVYETGRITNGGQGLAKIPIIDVREYTDFTAGANVHQKYYSFALRDRLQKANGTFANHILIVASTADTNKMGDYAIAKMDQWLTALKKDTSNAPAMQKMAKAKPADLTDGCYSKTGELMSEPQTFSGGKCNDLYKTFSSPRMVAGDPIANNIYKCQLKPVDRKDYQVQLSDAEWAQLKSTFSGGVCDWSKAGVSQRAPKGTWLSYPESSDQGKLARPGNIQPSAFRADN